MHTFFGVICFPFMERDKRSNFFGGWTISSPNGRGSWLLFLKVGFVPLVYNCFLDRDTIESAFLFRQRRQSQFMSELPLVR